MTPGSKNKDELEKAPRGTAPAKIAKRLELSRPAVFPLKRIIPGLCFPKLPMFPTNPSVHRILPECKVFHATLNQLMAVETAQHQRDVPIEPGHDFSRGRERFPCTGRAEQPW
jgi:hypothetical protein